MGVSGGWAESDEMGFERKKEGVSVSELCGTFYKLRPWMPLWRERELLKPYLLAAQCKTVQGEDFFSKFQLLLVVLTVVETTPFRWATSDHSVYINIV